MCGRSNGKVRAEVLEACEVLLLQRAMLAASLWWMSKLNVALLQVSSCFDGPGTPGEQWYYTVFMEEPGKVQITQILNVKKGWLAEELTHLFVAVKCGWLIPSYPEVVSSSMQGDADTINLFLIIKVQMRQLFWDKTAWYQTQQSWSDECFFIWCEWRWIVWVVLLEEWYYF